MRISIALTTVLLLTASPVFATSSEDSAYDKGGSSVIDSRGNCVRTKWMGENDPCAPNAAPAALAEPAPAPAPAPAVMPTVSLEQRTVYFDFDSAALNADATSKLDELIAILGSAKAVDGLTVHGFTDQMGDDGYNVALANRRVAAVRAYLDSHSRLDTSRGELRGIGKSAATEGCAGKARRERIVCMAGERRVEIEIKAEK